jgi:hypothetical protein
MVTSVVTKIMMNNKPRATITAGASPSLILMGDANGFVPEYSETLFNFLSDKLK